MAKSILKEIFIILLVCIALVLVMAVIFYNYIPNNKIIPAKVTAYSTPENVEAEISSNVTNTFSMEDEDYKIENSDLTKYQQVQSYNPGKPDPFALYTESNVTNTNGVSGNADTSNNNANKNVTDNFYQSQNVHSGTK